MLVSLGRERGRVGRGKKAVLSRPPPGHVLFPEAGRWPGPPALKSWMYITVTIVKYLPLQMLHFIQLEAAVTSVAVI